MKKLLLFILFFTLYWNTNANWYYDWAGTHSKSSPVASCGATYCETNPKEATIAPWDNEYDDWSSWEVKWSINSSWAAWFTEIGSTVTSSNKYSWDSASPTTNHDYPYHNVRTNWSSKTIKFNPNDFWWSWLNTTKYCEWSWCTPSTVWTEITVWAPYDGSIRFQAWDNISNASSIYEVIVKLDNTPPTVWYIISWWTTNNDEWSPSAVTVTINCNDWGGSTCDASTYSYIESTSNLTCDASSTWWAAAWSSSTTIDTPSGTNLIKYVCFRAKDNSWNWFVYSWTAIVKIDREVPKVADISWNWDTLNATDFVAIDPKDFSISVDVSNGSPIVSIKWYFERHDVAATDANVNTNWEYVSSLNWNLNLSRNVSIVDNWVNDSVVGWNYRIYSFKITEIRDEVWNAVFNPVTYNYFVYANNVDSTKTTVSWANNLISAYIADGTTERLLSVYLKDTYGNKIIPVNIASTGFIRNVDLTMNFDNQLFLNQYTGLGNAWVKVTGFEDSIFAYAGASQATTITDLANNWEYTIKFKVYSPTTLLTASDWREYVDWSFSIDAIFWWVSDISWNIWVGTPISFQFVPIYYTDNSWWDISATESWFVETNTQTWTIVINNNWGSDPATRTLYYTKTWTAKDDFTWTWEIVWANKKTFPSYLSSLGTEYISAFNNTSYELITKFKANTWVYADSINNLSLSAYISYIIWSDNETVTYKAWIINEGANLGFEYLKIHWVANIDKDKQGEILADHDADDIHNLAWSIVKSRLKRDLIKKVISTIKFISSIDVTLPIKDLTWTIWNESNNWWKILGSILYYNITDWTNVILWDLLDLSVEWRKTIIVIWWNLRITQNIINSTNTDMLWIVVLKDDNGNWWKLYIDTSVNKIDAAIYLDKSIISYDENYTDWNVSALPDPNNILEHEIEWAINQTLMQNQLYIYGSVFSENTIWGSRKSPAICPFWTESIIWFACEKESQKYDLNYLRSWYNNKYIPAYWDYPIIIKYNPAIQSTPPPLFVD